MKQQGFCFPAKFPTTYPSFEISSQLPNVLGFSEPKCQLLQASYFEISYCSLYPGILILQNPLDKTQVIIYSPL